MKRIGLLTFHYPINYGAILQTYATVKKITSSGHDVCVIDYYSDEQIGHYDFYKSVTSVKMLTHYMIKSLFYFDYQRKKNKFRVFRNKYFKTTQHFDTLSKIDFQPYDIILTGSDQVFNLSKRDRTPYYQPFNKREGQLKAAYAPSFGIKDFDKETLSLIKSYTKEFDYLSCREQEGAELLSNLIGKPVVNVLDPVFLLSSNEWSEIASERLIEQDYIFIYDLNGKENLIKIANRVKSQHMNYKIVLISNDPIAPIRNSYRDVDVLIRTAGIEEFLSLVKYSSVVLTDSFHGTAFSIIFKKQFYTFIALEKASGRITSLMSNFKIQDRIVRTRDIESFEIKQLSYDFEAIEKEIDNSQRFFQNILS